MTQIWSWEASWDSPWNDEHNDQIRNALRFLNQPELWIQPSHDPLLVWYLLKPKNITSSSLGLCDVLLKLLRLSTSSFQAPLMTTFLQAWQTASWAQKSFYIGKRLR